jgi:hypothetical protein
LKTSAEGTEDLSTQLHPSIRRLRDATVLLDFNNLANMDQSKLDDRQVEIDALLKLYTNQIAKDYYHF